MFFNFTSLLATLLKPFEYLLSFVQYRTKIKFVSINLGGREHNPFEYYFKTNNDTPFRNHKNIMNSLDKTTLLEILDEERFCTYDMFRRFVRELKQEHIYDYFFTTASDCKQRLTLENKYGRGEGYRLNPIEHGYDEIYHDIFDGCQYEYIRKCSIDSVSFSDLVYYCIQTLDKNDFDNMSGFYNLVLFDILNISAVYHHFNEFDTIFIPKHKDTRIEQITKDGIPSIIVTQEKKIKETELIRCLASSDRRDGTNIYSFNIPDEDIDVLSVTPIPESCNNYIGNTKGVVAHLELYGKSIYVNAIHAKDFSKVMPDENTSLLVDYGIIPLINKNLNSDSLHLLMGDFNPSTNQISNQLKQQISSKLSENNERFENVDITIFPTNVDDFRNIQNTTKKIRSGYCAQMSKFFNVKNSEISKDMIIYYGDKTHSKETYTAIYPPVDTLLSKYWIGDHSSISMTLEL